MVPSLGTPISAVAGLRMAVTEVDGIATVMAAASTVSAIGLFKRIRSSPEGNNAGSCLRVPVAAGPPFPVPHAAFPHGLNRITGAGGGKAGR